MARMRIFATKEKKTIDNGAGVQHRGGMPGQRAKDKVMVGGFIQKSLKSRLKILAKKRKVTMTELAVELFEEGVKRHLKGSKGRGR